MKLHRTILALTCAALSACTMGPDYKRPEIQAPAQWRQAEPVTADGSALANSAWWKLFQDPELERLISVALQENKELRTAAIRIEEYEARLQISRAARLPQVAYGGNAGRNMLSEQRQVPLPANTPLTAGAFEAQWNVSWELDVWGRIRRSNEAALAELLAAEESQRAVLMSLVAEVATTYVNMLRLDREVELWRQLLASRADSLRVQEAKLAGGGTSRIPVEQARSAYEETAAAIPPLEREIASLEQALSILIGRDPGPIRRGARLDTLAVPGIPQGLPSELLDRRPDIRKAEQDLIAANARIGVAKTQYFPTISLTGLFGFASTELSNIYLRSANFGVLTGSVVGPIFTGGRIEANIKETEAMQRRLLVAYQRVIQAALGEVENSLVYHRKTGERLDALARQIQALRESAVLIRKRQLGGQVSMLEVFDAERVVLDAELVQARTAVDTFTSVIAVYKAMGGGWIVEAEKLGSAAGAPDAMSASSSPESKH